MDHSLPIISLNVIEILMKLYSRKKDDLLHIISTSPKTSVLRVNYCHPKAKEAKCILQTYLNTLSDKSYTVSSHHLLNDVLMITAEKSDYVHQHFEKEVIVDTCCGSAVLRGADIFAPGVLAAHPGMRKGDIVSVYVDLEKKCRRGLVKQFDGRKYYLGNGIALYGRQELFENNCHINGTAIKMTHCHSHHPSFANLDTSMFFPQNLPSILVGHIVNPQETDIILDMCASPGGKTTHIGCLLKNKGYVIAIDKTQKKVDRINTNCTVLGLSNVKTYCYDSTKLVSEQCELDISISIPINGPPFCPGSFDKILLDPPCSGLGQRPQLHYVMKNKELLSYSIYQKRLLKQAVSLLKPGGCLVYSTCTLLPEENEEQVSWVLKTFPEMKLCQQNLSIGRPGLDGYGLNKSDCEKLQRFDQCYLPESNAVTVDLSNGILQNSDYDTIGFFIANFFKNE